MIVTFVFLCQGVDRAVALLLACMIPTGAMAFDVLHNVLDHYGLAAPIFKPIGLQRTFDPLAVNGADDRKSADSVLVVSRSK